MSRPRRGGKCGPRSLERARPLEATWLVVTPPCPDVRLGQRLCGGRGAASQGHPAESIACESPPLATDPLPWEEARVLVIHVDGFPRRKEDLPQERWSQSP